MKIYFILWAFVFPTFCFSQTIDTSQTPTKVDSLKSLADSLLIAGKASEALVYAQEALDLSKITSGEETIKYSDCLNQVGACQMKLSDFGVAEESFLQATAIQQILNGEDHPDYATCLNNLVGLYASTGRYPEADSLCHIAIEIRKKTLGDKHEDFAASLNSLATLKLKSGKFQEALPILLEVKEIWEHTIGEEHPDYNKCLNNLAIACRRLGRYEEAEPLYLKAKDLREKIYGKNHPDYAASLNGLAVFYHSTQRLEKAEPLYLESLEITKNTVGKKSIDYTNSLNNLAVLYKSLGRYEEAETLYLELKSILQETLGTEHPDYASCLNNLSIYYRTIGQLDRAKEEITEALRIWREVLGEDHPNYARGLINLGNIYYEMKQYEKAEQLYLQAKAIREITVGKEHIDYAEILNNLGSLYAETKNYDKAELFFSEAKLIREKKLGKSNAAYASSLKSMADLYYHKGNYDKALPFYNESKSILEQAYGKNHPDLVKILNNLASLHWRLGNLDTAAQYFSVANTIQHDFLIKSAHHLSEAELADFENLYLKFLHSYFSFALSHPSIANKLAGDLFNNALFYKGFLLTSICQVRRLVKEDEFLTPQFELLTSYHRRLVREYAKPIGKRKNVEGLEEKANALEKELTRSVAGMENELHQISWQDVLATLQPGESAVEFFRYRLHSPEPTDSFFYCALVLQHGKDTPQWVSMAEEQAFLPLLKGATGNNYRKINSLYSESALYDLIMKPLETHQENSSTIYFSPSGILHQLNLKVIAAQPYSKLKTKNFIRLASTRQLLFTETEKLTNGKTAYVVGGVRYQTDSIFVSSPVNDKRGREAGQSVASFSKGRPVSNLFWEYLSGSIQEALAISSALQDASFAVQLDTGHFASEEAFQILGTLKTSSPYVLHLATHGFFFPNPDDMPTDPNEPIYGYPIRLSNNPMIRSGMVLADAQQAWTGEPTPEGQEDGILTAYEISQMDLSKTELVVLSACETGLGEIQGNEGVYGLQRAFKIAGARYLIMSLWKVNDESTKEFMLCFYGEWLGKKLTIPEAFKNAQSKMKIKYPTAPFHWAGFILVE